MKKNLLTICLIIATITAFGQSSQESTVAFGIKGGVNFASLLQTEQGSASSISSGSLTSFHAGIFADFKLGDSFSVQPSLLYTEKGATDKENVSSVGFSESSNVKLTINYLQLPIYALYHKHVGNNDFFIGAGPFIAYGLSGKEKGSATETSEEPVPPNEQMTVTRTSAIDDKVNFGDSDTSDVKRVDYGVSAMIGFKFNNGFLISAYYDLGLANIAPTSDADIKTRVFGVSVGYSF